MLTNGRVTVLFDVVSFARPVWSRSAWTGQLLSKPSQHMLVFNDPVVVVVVIVVVITPPLPRDGDTARTAIQVHAVNLIEIRLGQRWQPISNQ